LGLERLYHRVRADEEAGIKLFQEMAERLARYRLINSLRILMNDVDSYPLEHENSRLWRWYYNVRLNWHGDWQDDIEVMLQDIGQDTKAEPRLRAYALCDLGQILTGYMRLSHGVEESVATIESSMRFGLLDSHLNQNYFSLARVALYEGQWAKYKGYLEQAKISMEQQGDLYGLAYVYSEMMESGGPHGTFKEYFAAHEKGVAVLSQISSDPLPLKARLFRKWLRVWAFAGRYNRGEQIARECLRIERETHDDHSSTYTLRDLGWILGFQDKFEDAEKCFEQSLALCGRLGNIRRINEARVMGLQGVVLGRRGEFEQAKGWVLRSFEAHQVESYFPGSLLEVKNWLGLISELQGKWLDAYNYYKECSDWKRYGSYYFECTALTGLVRVKHAQGECTAIPPLLAEAEQLAQQYEYNDHLASLRLTQAQIFQVSEDLEGLTALDYFKQAMIYALRYNRFLLDEVLSGRPQGTPLRPIIPYCIERGEEGRQMLIALRDWWKTGVNDIGIPRPDTISPIPEGIPLLEAERIARGREPGDGTKQTSVMEQIESALEK